jgi:hypothetical protein
VNSVYLQAQAADYLEPCSSVGLPSGPSSGMTTAVESLSSGSETVSCPPFPSTRWTSENLTDESLHSTQDWLMSLPQDSTVNPGVRQEKVLVPTTRATPGLQPLSAFALYGHATRSWRTCRVSLLQGTSEPYSKTWPRAGMMRDGMCFQRRRLLTKEMAQDSGFWYRPVARDWKGYTKRAGESLCNQLKKLYPDTSGKPMPEFIEQVMGWPIGWSALEPLETGKFQLWLEQHGIYSQEENNHDHRP